MDAIILAVLCMLVVLVSVYATIDNYLLNKEKYNSMFENCVLCNKELNVRKDLDINQRLYYIEGAGQLCKDCFESTYPE